MASGSLIGRSNAREQQDKLYSRKNQSKSESPMTVPHQYHQEKCSQRTLANSTDDNIPVASDDSSSRPGARNHCVPSHEDEVPGFANYDNSVNISFDLRDQKEVRALKRKLAIELDQVTSLVKRLETKQIPLSKTVNRNAATEFVKKIGSNHGILGGSVEKRKMASATNRFNKNLDVLGSEKVSIVVGNDKLKSNIKGNELVSNKDFSRLFKSSDNLLERLMKHKYGWVFNKPVDAEGLGLIDYYTIIKHPMDLGTVMARLRQNLYKSPTEFAKDVRLTFSNAMLYNPKGQDVHIMAEELSKIFEETWTKIEAEYNFSRLLKRDLDSGPASASPKKVPVHPSPVLTTTSTLSAPIHTPTPAPVPPDSVCCRTLAPSASVHTRTPVPPPSVYLPTPAPSAPVCAPSPPQQLLEMRTLERPESLTMPEVKDPDTRDMTYKEKQRLSLNLQELPSEKLENVVQIIKKRNPVLSQQDDEIEVDIDCFDPETLWELDRFVSNYKKSLTQNNGNADVALNIQNINMEPLIVETPKATEAVDVGGFSVVQKTVSTSSPVLEEKHGHNGNESSSSSASSNDSGSSTADAMMLDLLS